MPITLEYNTTIDGDECDVTFEYDSDRYYTLPSGMRLRTQEDEREPSIDIVSITSQYSDDVLRDMTAVQIVLLERELWEHVKQLEESYRKL